MNTPYFSRLTPTPTRLPPVSLPPAAVHIVVTLTEPPDERLVTLSRCAKHHYLVEHSHQQQSALLQWIAGKQLTDELLEVAPSTVFDLVFLRGTRHLAKVLRTAPNVQSVVVVDDHELELISPLACDECADGYDYWLQPPEPGTVRFSGYW